MGIHQGKLLSPDAEREDQTYLERMGDLLSQNFDFHSQDSSYASHNFHAFPAKFPPQLPQKFIQELTGPGDAVLDPGPNSSNDAGRNTSRSRFSNPETNARRTHHWFLQALRLSQGQLRRAR